MTALPATAARASVESELDAARQWAIRHDWLLNWNPDALQLRLTTYHRPVGRIVELTASVDGYRAIPPAWTFVRPGTDDIDPATFPAAGQIPGVGSIFHGGVVICASWNRLAYQEHGGPHDNWSGPAAWLQVQEGTIAHTIPDMLAIIDVHLSACRGFMR